MDRHDPVLGNRASGALAAVGLSSVMGSAFLAMRGRLDKGGGGRTIVMARAAWLMHRARCQIVERRERCLDQGIVAHRQIGGAPPIHVEPYGGAREGISEAVRRRGIGAVRRQPERPPAQRSAFRPADEIESRSNNVFTRPLIAYQ